MNRIVYTILCLILICVGASAQEVRITVPDSTATTTGKNIGASADVKTGEIRLDTVMPAIAVCPDESVLEALSVDGAGRRDSLHLPVLNSFGQVPYIGMYPLGWGGMYNWDLHEGLNVSLGASAFAAFGKHAPRGAGFSQNISAMYAVPLSGKLSFAVGGYFNNVYWTSRSYQTAGLNAVLGYKFNERWEAYLYGQKSVVNKRMPPLLYDMNDLGDRIGAAVKYNFSHNFSVRVSIEERRY